MEFLGAFPGEATTLAIDNVVFKNCGRPSPTTGACPSNQFKCKNNICINSLNLCDNLNDCGDESDETNELCAKNQVLPCTFEADSASRAACNWTQQFDSGSNLNWKTKTTLTANLNSNMIRMTGPTFDHTYQLANR